jgi:hypothetical protein
MVQCQTCGKGTRKACEWEALTQGTHEEKSLLHTCCKCQPGSCPQSSLGHQANWWPGWVQYHTSVICSLQKCSIFGRSVYSPILHSFFCAKVTGRIFMENEKRVRIGVVCEQRCLFLHRGCIPRFPFADHPLGHFASFLCWDVKKIKAF